MIRFKNGTAVKAIVCGDFLNITDITDGKKRKQFEEECKVSLVKTTFTNDRGQKVQTVEWVVTHTPTGDTFTHSLYSFIYDRVCKNITDTEIQVGETFWANRIVFGEKNNNRDETAVLRKNKEGELYIEEI